ncbi:MAG: dTMP kinase [Rickettsiales bacterium]
MFISFEGGEGSGKSTQAKMLAEFFRAQGKDVILTREPGGTEIAEEIRTVILSKAQINDPLTEMLLLSAARRDHVENLIKPALALGKVVISDRFVDSSVVYQSYVKELDIVVLNKLINISIGDFAPDITFLIDVAVEIGLARIASNRRQDTNHYDNQNLEFHQKVREGFLDLAHKNIERMMIIDGGQDIEEVSKSVRRVFL